jgi:beta-lactamase regulating signal transducer with metallopeptidase domain
MIAASLNAISGSRYWIAGGWTMLHFLWIGLAIGVFTLLIRQTLDRARAEVRHACVLICFFALVISPVPIYRWVLATTAPVSAGASAGSISGAKDLLGRAVAHAGGQANGLPFNEISVSQSKAAPSPGRGFFGRVTGELDEIAVWLPVVWVSGVPLMLLMFLAGLIGAQRLREQADRLVGKRLVGRLDRLCMVMGVRRGRVVVAVSRAVRAPILVGLFKPMILLPVALLSELTPQQLELILVHELAHVRRWDNLVNLIQRVAEGLLFFHPAVWVVSRWLRLEREHCCDAIVLRHVDRPRMYVETLASLATPESGPRHALAAMANQQLVWRVRRILRSEDRTMCVSRKTLAGGVAAVMVLAAWLGMALAGDEKPAGRESVNVPADAPAVSAGAAAGATDLDAPAAPSAAARRAAAAAEQDVAVAVRKSLTARRVSAQRQALTDWIGAVRADDEKLDRAAIGIPGDVAAAIAHAAAGDPHANLAKGVQCANCHQQQNWIAQAPVVEGGVEPAPRGQARPGAAATPARVRNTPRAGRMANVLDLIDGDHAGLVEADFNRVARTRLGMGDQINRPWGPEQATGAPNVPVAADDGRAWASLSPDGQDEWLELRYNTAVETSDILVYESFNPGAISEVIVTDDKGARYRVFQGKDPSAGTDMAVLVVTLAKAMRVTTVRLEIASTKVPGWNEIDAVGLVDAASGKVSWADSAKASSTYAEPAAAPQQQATEVERLRKEIEDLRKQLEEQRKRGQREAI